jgi:hypothetical protein
MKFQAGGIFPSPPIAKFQIDPILQSSTIACDVVEEPLRSRQISLQIIDLIPQGIAEKTHGCFERKSL